MTYDDMKETTAPNKKERYRPAVKFRKIDKALLERLQTGGPESTVTGNLDNAQEEAAEIQDDDSDDEELIAEENLQGGQPQSDSTVGGDGGAGGLKLAFAVDSQIDLNSRALLDMISEEAVVVTNQSLAPAGEITTGEMSIDEAFDNW
jgi:hypothetical protein